MPIAMMTMRKAILMSMVLLGSPSGTSNKVNSHLALGQNQTPSHSAERQAPSPLTVIFLFPLKCLNTNGRRSILFYLTGMFGVTAVLDLSPPEPVEMWTQSASHVWGWTSSTDPGQMWSSTDHWRASITCTFTENVWETCFAVINTHCAEVQ